MGQSYARSGAMLEGIRNCHLEPTTTKTAAEFSSQPTCGSTLARPMRQKVAHRKRSYSLVLWQFLCSQTPFGNTFLETLFRRWFIPRTVACRWRPRNGVLRSAFPNGVWEREKSCTPTFPRCLSFSREVARRPSSHKRGHRVAGNGSGCRRDRSPHLRARRQKRNGRSKAWASQIPRSQTSFGNDKNVRRFVPHSAFRVSPRPTAARSCRIRRWRPYDRLARRPRRPRLHGVP